MGHHGNQRTDDLGVMRLTKGETGSQETMRQAQRKQKAGGAVSAADDDRHVTKLCVEGKPTRLNIDALGRNTAKGTGFSAREKFLVVFFSAF